VTEPTAADELPKLLDLALAEVQAGTRELVERHNLTSAPGYHLDPAIGSLSFGKDTFDAQFVGAFDPASKQWRWAWADPAIPKHLLLPANHAKAFGETNGLSELTTATIPADETTAWRWAALAARLADWPGIYACPLPTGVTVFVAFRPQIVGTLGSISVSKGPVS
jgi:hypothetical protein